MSHSTQVFLSNPQALRAEFRLDDERLELWWSPLAGVSTACADRNFSSRDAHLDVFAAIHVPGCGLDGFRGCDYDPYHCVLRWENRALHLALRPDLAAAFLWAEGPVAVDFKTGRDDLRLDLSAHSLLVAHAEGGREFEFAAALGAGAGTFRHGPGRVAHYPKYSRAELAPGQLLVIGVGLKGEGIGPRVVEAAAKKPAQHLAETDRILAPHEASGRIVSSGHPDLVALRRGVVRGLHSMIDESGAYRASLKAIYYLIWVRDSAFSFAYQEAAGWPHKLPELCRLLLDNPTTVHDAGLPQSRMFAQLVHRELSKLEEDGLFYVVWTLFVQWGQGGLSGVVSDADWALVDEALAWVESVTWDEGRGLYGGHFADETPAKGHRDHGWDHAIGQPSGCDDVIRMDGRPVARIYDVYFNLCMHSTHVMLHAMRGREEDARRAARVWPELEKLLAQRTGGIPVYGEALFEDGTRALWPHWGGAPSCCVWGLTLPNFAPLADWDSVRAAVLDAIIAAPDMHWINGICSAMSAVDPWVYPEEKLLALHRRLADETNRPGKFLPMGGAMPEKFNAPEGNMYHDIRPQGFAMGAWLASWSALGLRRLPRGLALRPTGAFEKIENYAWRGGVLDVHFGPRGRSLALEVDGCRIEGTLQIPGDALSQKSEVRLVASQPGPLWLRSTVDLRAVADGPRSYTFEAFGLSSVTFSEPVPQARFESADGSALAVRWTECGGLATAHFEHRGPARCVLG